MGRPKGSTNKKKETVKPEPVAEKWQPKPDMGAVKPPPDKLKLCAHCEHEKEHHYGQDKDWCNLSKCQCQAFQ